MKRLKTSQISALFIGLFVGLSASAAVAEQVHYIGIHPIVDADAKFCYIEVPHVHVYKPKPEHEKVLYVVDNDRYHFVGDPVGFGYEGDKHPYYGHHPIVVDVDVDVDVVLPEYDDDYCYMDGPHYHHYAPSPDLKFELKGGAYWYVGAYPAEYKKRRKDRDRIDVVYEPLIYERPVIDITVRPVAYVGPIVVVDGPDVIVEAPDVIIETPRPSAVIDVAIPVPSIDISIGGGVIVHDHGHPGRRRGHYKKHKKYKKWK